MTISAASWFSVTAGEAGYDQNSGTRMWTDLRKARFLRVSCQMELL